MHKELLKQKLKFNLLSFPLSARLTTHAIQATPETQQPSARGEVFGNDYYRSTPCIARVRGRGQPQEGLLW